MSSTARHCLRDSAEAAGYARNRESLRKSSRSPGSFQPAGPRQFRHLHFADGNGNHSCAAQALRGIRQCCAVCCIGCIGQITSSGLLINSTSRSAFVTPRIARSCFEAPPADLPASLNVVSICVSSSSSTAMMRKRPHASCGGSRISGGSCTVLSRREPALCSAGGPGGAHTLRRGRCFQPRSMLRRRNVSGLIPFTAAISCRNVFVSSNRRLPSATSAGGIWIPTNSFPVPEIKSAGNSGANLRILL